MSELGNIFSSLKEQKKEKKLSNIEHSTMLIINSKFDFEQKNNGIHLVVYAGNDAVDFWPSTGKWIVRSNKKTARGVKQLLTECERISSKWHSENGG